MTISQFFSFALSLIAVAFIGRLGEEEMAISVLATSFMNVTGFSLVLGLLGALDTLCGQAWGARNYRALGVTLQKAVVTTLATSLAVCLLWAHVEPLMLGVGQQPRIAAGAARFLLLATPALIFAGMFECIKRYLMAQVGVGWVGWVGACGWLAGRGRLALRLCERPVAHCPACTLQPSFFCTPLHLPACPPARLPARLPACLPAAGCSAASHRGLLCSRGAGAAVQLPPHFQARLWAGWRRVCHGAGPRQHAAHAVCLPGVAGAAAAGHPGADLARMVGGCGGAWLARQHLLCAGKDTGGARGLLLGRRCHCEAGHYPAQALHVCPPARLPTCPPACLPIGLPACRSRDCFKGLGTYYRLAVPSTLMVCLEWWAYEFCIFMSGWLPNPTLNVAAMGVMLQVSGFCYMLPMVRLSSGCCCILVLHSILLCGARPAAAGGWSLPASLARV